MSEAKVAKQVTVTNPEGVHARPADMIVKAAARFRSQVTIIRGYERIDTKSILSILTIGATCGTELTLEACGPDAQEAIDCIIDLFRRNFEEENETSGGK